MSLALIREHADVKEEFERLNQIRNERFFSSISNMIGEIKRVAAKYMKDNAFAVKDIPEEKAWRKQQTFQ